jgi:hypothetical protein
LQLISVSCSAIQPLSAITVSLYAKSTIHKDILIGRKEITTESQRGSSFFRFLIQLAEHLLDLDIILSSTDRHQTESATVLTITIAPVRPDADNQTDLTGAALHRAEKAIDTMETWSGAVDIIKRVTDAVGSIAAVCPISLRSSPFAELT